MGIIHIQADKTSLHPQASADLLLSPTRAEVVSNFSQMGIIRDLTYATICHPQPLADLLLVPIRPLAWS